MPYPLAVDRSERFSEAWYVPPRLFARCGRTRNEASRPFGVGWVKNDGASFRLIDLA